MVAGATEIFGHGDGHFRVFPQFYLAFVIQEKQNGKPVAHLDHVIVFQDGAHGDSGVVIQIRGFLQEHVSLHLGYHG